jgi:integrase/recombinase XerC
MTTQPPSAPADREVLDAARVLLSRMGVDPAELLATPMPRRPVPTFAVYIPVVSAAVSAGTRGTYGSYWDRLEQRWGDRRIDEPTASEIQALAEDIKATAVIRRNSRGGRSTAENFIAAVRCLYRHAEDDQLMAKADNPARKVDKPRRLPSTRRALTDANMTEINHVAATTGDDPELDTILLRLHTETAARRGGALHLRPRDLDRDQCVVLLREKGQTQRWQPVSPTLMTHLLDHAEERGADDPNGPLLRYRHGVPITSRRYDHLWQRLGRYLPWVATQNVSTHWLRHTTLTWVERNFGFAIAHAYAGHFDDNDSATLTYVRATVEDVATALAALTGEPHPLAVAA